MRVYQVNVVCGGGSTGRIAADLARAVERGGGSCRVAYGRGGGEPGLDCVRVARRAEVCAHALLTRAADRHGLGSRAATARLARDIASYGPDLVHLHNLHGYYLNYEALFRFLRGYGRPVVWTMHDCWAFTGHCAHYEGAGCGRWAEPGGCRDCPAPGAYPAALGGGNAADNFRRKRESFTSLPGLTVVSPSRWLDAQLARSFLGGARRATIPNGVDLGTFRPRGCGAREAMGCGGGRRLALGVAGTWTRAKGLEDFARLRGMLGPGWAVCMVGLDGAQMRRLPPGVTGLGRARGAEELAGYYSAADVFLNLTYEDTFPTTNLEALACGTPVVTYASGGSPEAVAEGCGLAVARGDLGAVAAALEGGRLEEWGRRDACLARAADFDRDRCHGRYLELYRGILGGA